jgi:hypothetical protein
MNAVTSIGLVKILGCTVDADWGLAPVTAARHFEIV